MDCLMQGLAERHHLALTIAEVTDTAKLLERKHLCGPTAGRALAESLGMIAVMSGNLAADDERICAQFVVDGPLGACVTDAGADGRLRGYTNIKLLNDLDGADDSPLAQALGKSGQMAVVQSTGSKIVYSAQVRVNPPSARTALARYFNESLQRPAAVEIIARSKGGYLERALAVMAEKMPDASSEDFLPVLEAFDDGRIRRMMEEDFSWRNLTALTGLEDLQIGSVRELRFGCDCSYERVFAAVRALAREELEDIARERKGQEVTCHFCGRDYLIKHAEIVKILQS